MQLFVVYTVEHVRAECSCLWCTQLSMYVLSAVVCGCTQLGMYVLSAVVCGVHS